MCNTWHARLHLFPLRVLQKMSQLSDLDELVMSEEGAYD